MENKQQQCSVAPSLCWLLLFPLHLNIRGLWTPIGPGKLFMGVLESPEFLVSKRVGTLISVCNQPPISTQPFVPLGLVYLTSFAVDFLSISVRTLWSFCWTYVTAYRHHCLTNMSVWRIRNCCAYSKPVTSHAFSGLAGSRPRWPPSYKYDVISKIGLRQSMHIYLNNPAKFCPDTIWNKALDFLKSIAPTRTRTMSSDVRSVPDQEIRHVFYHHVH